jgi:hypothetical protein
MPCASFQTLPVFQLQTYTSRHVQIAQPEFDDERQTPTFGPLSIHHRAATPVYWRALLASRQAYFCIWHGVVDFKHLLPQTSLQQAI